MALYISQLHAGHWYLSAETNSPKSLRKLTFTTDYNRAFPSREEAAAAKRDCYAHHCGLSINPGDFLRVDRIMAVGICLAHIAYFKTDTGLRCHGQTELIRDDQGAYGQVILDHRIAGAGEAAPILELANLHTTGA